MRFKRPTSLQSILFLRTRWTPIQARAWLKTQGYSTRMQRSPKSDDARYFRFRQATPTQFKGHTFRTITLGEAKYGIKAIIAVKKKAPKRPNPARSQSEYFLGYADIKRLRAVIKSASDRAAINRLEDFRGTEADLRRAVEMFYSAGKLQDAKRLMDMLPKKKNPRPPVRHPNVRLNVPDVLADLGRALAIELTNGQTIDFSRGWIFAATENGKSIWVIKPARRRKVKEVNRHTLVRKAESLYGRFTDFEPNGYEKANIKTTQKRFRIIGRVKSFAYESDKWSGKKAAYIHKFSKPPTCWSNEDGAATLFKIRGTKLRITVNGIEG